MTFRAEKFRGAAAPRKRGNPNGVDLAAEPRIVTRSVSEEIQTSAAPVLAYAPGDDGSISFNELTSSPFGATPCARRYRSERASELLQARPVDLLSVCP